MKQAERMKAAGKQQVLLWLSIEAKARLERLALSRVQTQVAVVEAALLALEGGPAADPGEGISAQLDSLERRFSALEATIKELTNERRTDDSALSEVQSRVKEVQAKSKLFPLEQMIHDLAAEGKTTGQIANALNDAGFKTDSGKPFQAGHSKIRRAVGKS